MHAIVNEIAWPTASLVAVIVFFLFFKRPITSFIDRAKRIGRTGVEAYEAQQPAPPAKADPLTEYMATFGNPLLAQVETNISEELKTRHLEDPTAAKKALIRALAGRNIELHFERAYAAMWASQLQVLRFVNTRSGPVQIDEIRPIYEAAAGRYPTFYKDYTLDAYLTFLQSHTLIERHDHTISITLGGNEFLKWLIEMRKPDPFVG